MSIIVLGQVSASGNLDEMSRRTFTRTFELLTDDLSEFANENAVMNALGVRLYQAHPSYPHAYVTGIDVDTIGGVALPNGIRGCKWRATVRYGRVDPERREMMDPETGIFSALNLPPRARWDGENEEVPALKTWDEIPILNSCGDVFDPPPMRQQYRGTLVVNVNMPTVDFNAMFAYSNKVNSDTWNGFDPGTVMVFPISMPNKEIDQETDIYYYPMEFRFGIKPDGWKRKLLNAGLRQLASAGGTKRVPIMVDGVPASSPVLLDEDGKALDPPVDGDNIVYLEFEIEEPISFLDAFGEEMASLT